MTSAYVIDPQELHACVTDCLDDHHKGLAHDGLFEHLRRRLFRQYAPQIVGCTQFSHDVFVYYTSSQEALLLFRNRKKCQFLTRASEACSTWDIVVKGRLRAESLAKVSPGAVYFYNPINGANASESSPVQWLRSGDMLAREPGAQSKVGIDRDSYILEYIRGSSPYKNGSSLLDGKTFDQLQCYNPGWWESAKGWVGGWWYGGGGNSGQQPQ